MKVIPTGYEVRMQKRRAARLHMMKAEADGRTAPKGFRNNGAVSRKTKQELHCHNCGMYVQFLVDLSLEGQHKFNCPECNHEHYRVVRNGVITSERWGQDPSQGQNSGATYTATVTGTSTTAVYTTMDSTSGSSTAYNTSAAAIYYNDPTGYFTTPT